MRPTCIIARNKRPHAKPDAPRKPNKETKVSLGNDLPFNASFDVSNFPNKTT